MSSRTVMLPCRIRRDVSRQHVMCQCRCCHPSDGGRGQCANGANPPARPSTCAPSAPAPAPSGGGHRFQVADVFLADRLAGFLGSPDRPGVEVRPGVGPVTALSAELSSWWVSVIRRLHMIGRGWSRAESISASHQAASSQFS